MQMHRLYPLANFLQTQSLLIGLLGIAYHQRQALQFQLFCFKCSLSCGLTEYQFAFTQIASPHGVITGGHAVRR